VAGRWSPGKNTRSGWLVAQICNRSANPVATLEQRNLVSGTLQVICGYQAVDTGANDGDVLRSLLHQGKESLTGSHAQGTTRVARGAAW